MSSGNNSRHFINIYSSESLRQRSIFVTYIIGLHDGNDSVTIV